MHQESPAAPPVVHGLGGMGKSTLALHFAHHVRDRDRYDPVWWIPAGSAASIASGLSGLAARLNPAGNFTAATSAEGAAWAIDWLQRHTGWLLVFDDADPRGIEPVLGTLSAGRHLITSRRATGWHRVARLHPLGMLPPDAAVDMLAQIARPGGDSGSADLAPVAAELGYLPLALEQAAAYIHAKGVTPATYLDRLRRFPARMFAVSDASEAAGEADDERTIARVWQLNLRALSEADPLTGDILRALAWYSPDPIPRDLAYGLHEDPLAVDDALGLLHGYNMARLTPESVTIHRLVQAVARLSDPADPYRTPEAVSQARDRASRVLLDTLPEAPLLNADGWPRWRELLPHALALAGHADPGQDTPETAAILAAASGFLLADGHFGQAAETAQRAVAAYERLQGPDAPDTLTARSFLASAYRAAGDLSAAAPLHQQNLADYQRVLGEDHPETLTARANLAYLYALQGEPGRAIELHRQNLAGYEQALGADHPSTLNARANLASSYRDSGDLPRAIELHQQCVTDYARVFGAGHPETVTARSNLAYAYQLAGDFCRAIELHREVLAARETIYSPRHPYTEVARQLLDRAEQQESARESADAGGQDAGE
jgi:hypothetical protein